MSMVKMILFSPEKLKLPCGIYQAFCCGVDDNEEAPGFTFSAKPFSITFSMKVM